MFFFEAEDGIRGSPVTGVQTCALPISRAWGRSTCKKYKKIARFRIFSQNFTKKHKTTQIFAERNAIFIYKKSECSKTNKIQQCKTKLKATTEKDNPYLNLNNSESGTRNQQPTQKQIPDRNQQPGSTTKMEYKIKSALKHSTH